MERILVTRASGRVGSEVVRRLLARGRYVMAGTHETARARADFGRTVEVIELDYDDPDTYEPALRWADRVLLIPPPFEARADERLIPFLTEAVTAGASHIVLLSGMGIEGFEHVPLHRVERRVRESGVAYTLLRPNWYMQNFLSPWLADPIAEKGAFALSTGEGAISFVDARDVMDAATEVLCTSAHYNAELTLTGPAALTHQQVARLLSYAAGREIRYTPVDSSRMRRLLKDAGWPTEELDVAIGLFRRMREGDRAEVTDDLARLLDRPPRSFADFATEHAAAFAGR
jgi:uncharacterized protein YbjT (DUF2867 family)